MSNDYDNINWSGIVMSALVGAVTGAIAGGFGALATPIGSLGKAGTVISKMNKGSNALSAANKIFDQTGVIDKNTSRTLDIIFTLSLTLHLQHYCKTT